jgi:two-component system, OmpR family, response regulator ChvI
VKPAAKKLLIVVDDEPDITSSLKLGLERRGMEVAVFNDPLKALEELKKHDKYDLVITDIRMPKMSGFELYREIRKQGVATPVVFMTAFDVYQEEFEKIFPDLKPKALLRKPLGIEELAARVNEILEGREKTG